MKKSTKNIIYILCYIGIFILVLFIFLPPLLKYLLPEGDGYTNVVKVELLKCQKVEEETGTKKVINTHYKDNKVELVEIAYTNVTEESIIDEKDFYKIEGVESLDDEGSASITINITPNNYNRNRLSQFFKSINTQKSIYEDGDYNYSCKIIDVNN